MKPGDAFIYLYEKKLPLILSFPFEEEKGYFITGRGLCYIEKIYNNEKILLSRFSPYRSIICIEKEQYFFANFEVLGKSYSCIFDNLSVENNKVTATIPKNMNPYLRRFLRVEPSIKLPVTLYLFSPEHGTISLNVKDISERGVGFLSQIVVNTNQQIVCGIRLPLQGETFVLSNASIVYKLDSLTKPESSFKTPSGQHISFSEKFKDMIAYGLELFPHTEDENKIRIYIMQRDIEIRRLLQEL
ncbi:MAG: hypothetical protein HXY52_03400 [Nitrospirae bacterium]|jgi:hypothetical protein|nr:hypothetical protein [Nitrospirota bacterium]